VVTNAIDAVSEKQPPGRVTVRTEYDAQNAKVRIIVEDDGPGIPADQMDFLFSPFVSSKKSRGTGLGLPVSQKILREHGGQIQVHSEPGRGARFVLEIPAVLPSPNQTGQEITIHSAPEKPEGPPAAEE
jgi:signal transduction histidine kinase